MIPLVPGLTVVEKYISESHAADLVTWIDAQPWSNAIRRRTQHYGWTYHYDRRPLERSSYLGDIPTPLAELAHSIRSSERISIAFDQAIVNEYLPDQGIGPHIDHVENFGAVIASVSLLSPTTMYFTRARNVVDVTLTPRALLLLTGEARYIWAHSIPSHDARRISITFRTARPHAR